MIEYQIEKNLSTDEFKRVLIESTLGERRPINDSERLKKMIEGADLIVTARTDGRLIGIARSITDFVYCTYLSDLAVAVEFQKKGIGKELIRQTKLATKEARLILLSAPKAIHYYPQIGMDHHTHCFYMDNIDQLK